MTLFLRSALLALLVLSGSVLSHAQEPVNNPPRQSRRDASQWNSLAAAVTALGSTSTLMSISTSVPLGASTVTIPASIQLEFIGPGQITGTGTLNVPSSVVAAPARKIFASTVAVSFAGNTVIKDYYPQWFGAVGNCTSDDAAAFAALYSSLPSFGGTIPLLPPSGGCYAVSSLPVVSKPIQLLGTVAAKAEFIDDSGGNPSFTRTAGAKFKLIAAASQLFKVYNVKGVRVQDVVFDANNLASVAIKIDRAREMNWSRVIGVRGTTAGWIIGSSSTDNNGSYFNEFHTCSAGGPSGVILNFFDGGSTGAYHNKFYGLQIEFTGPTSSDYGLKILSGDNNAFFETYVWNHTDQTNHHGIYISGPWVNEFSSYNSRFYGVQTIGMDIGAGNANAGVAIGYDQANGEPDVNIGAGSQFPWTSDGLGSTGWHLTTVAVNNLTVNAQVTGKGNGFIAQQTYFQAWNNANADYATSFGLGVPGGSATNDTYLSSYCGVPCYPSNGWTPILHYNRTSQRVVLDKPIDFSTPQIRVTASASQSIPSGAFTALAFDLNDASVNTDSMHSTTVNNDRITFNTSGTYLVGGVVGLAANANTSYRILDLKVNGTLDLWLGHMNPHPTAVVRISGSTLYHFNAGDMAQLLVYQDSGGNLSTNVTAGSEPALWAYRVSQ